MSKSMRLILTPGLTSWSPFFLAYPGIVHLRTQGKEPKPDGSDEEPIKQSLAFLPLALVLAGIAELNGARSKAINLAMASLAAFKIMHTEGSIKEKNGKMHKLGYFGTVGWLVAMSVYNLSLGWPITKEWLGIAST